MNRLQKKCLIATAGFHLLLLVILFVGPAFFTSKPKPDDSQVLDVIPANLVDAAVSSGVKGATPPPPTPVVTPQPAPPAPAPPPLRPTPAPVPQKVDRVEPAKPVKPDPTPVVKPTTVRQDKIVVNLKLTEHVVSKSSPMTATTDNSQRQARAIKKALQSLKSNLSSATTVDMPGDSSAAYTDYASVVKSIYEQAWMPPDNAANDDANAKVRVTIASDGSVISAQIITPSGDSGVDATVQRTLNRVTIIAPFPSGTTDKERTYIINFNLKAKRMLG